MNEIEAKQKELLEKEGNNSRTHLKIALITEGYEMAREEFIETLKWALNLADNSKTIFMKKYKQDVLNLIEEDLMNEQSLEEKWLK